MGSDDTLSKMAASQHGAFNSLQAAAAGFSRGGIDHRTDRGLYTRVAPSTYVIGGSTESWHRRVTAAALSLPTPAAASHRTAAILYGIAPNGDRPIEVIVRHWERRHRVAFVVHESRDLIAADIVVVDGIPTTTPERTLVDLGAVVPRWYVAAAFDTARRADLVTLDGVEAFVKRVARKGRRGVGAIRPVLEARRQWSGRSESELEDAFRRLLDRAGIHQPVPQYEVRQDGWLVCRADFAYPERKVLIELDGRRYHEGADAFQRDRTKQNLTQLRGWTTLRYTWDDVTRNPHIVVDQLLTVLA